MRQRLVSLHLHHFWINDNEAHFFGRETKEHAGNQSVDTDALPTTRGPGDKQVRHLRQIGDDSLAVNIFAERERNSCVLLRRLPIVRLEELAQFHRHLSGVSKFNPNGVFAGNRRENVDSLSARSSCKVALETHDLVHAHAFSRVNFVPRDGGTLCDVTRSYCDSKLSQRVDENLLDFL